MVLKIAQLGQPVLWQAAEPIPPAEIMTPDFQRFLEEMRETLREQKGAGLAAPQVFSSRRVFLAIVEPTEADDQPGAAEVFINPTITGVSQETAGAWEGCLSFPELLVKVERHQVVRVEYLDAAGEPRTLELADFPARVVQHEYDHLEGILTIDRIKSTRDIIKRSELEAVKEE